MILPGASIIQMAWLVNSLEEAASRFSKTMGGGPFKAFRHIQIQDGMHRGRPATFDFSLALMQAGDVQMELVQQHDNNPSVYRDIYAQGQEGFHHVAVIVPDVVKEAERYKALGFEIGSSGKFGDVDFVYVDTSPATGFMVEVLPDTPGIRALFGSVRKAAANWDGSTTLIG
jgi:Glyoxalase/Bleomycin resistance protein/Dioxygenase superfamily